MYLYIWLCNETPFCIVFTCLLNSNHSYVALALTIAFSSPVPAVPLLSGARSLYGTYIHTDEPGKYLALRVSMRSEMSDRVIM